MWQISTGVWAGLWNAQGRILKFWSTQTQRAKGGAGWRFWRLSLGTLKTAELLWQWSQKCLECSVQGWREKSKGRVAMSSRKDGRWAGTRDDRNGRSFCYTGDIYWRGLCIDNKETRLLALQMKKVVNEFLIWKVLKKASGYGRESWFETILLFWIHYPKRRQIRRSIAT